MFITFQPFFSLWQHGAKEVKQPQNVRFVVSKAVWPFYADLQLYVFLPSSQMQTVSYKYTRRAGNMRQFRRNTRPEGGLVISLSCHIYFVYQMGIYKEYDFFFFFFFFTEALNVFERLSWCLWSQIQIFASCSFLVPFLFFVTANTQLINRKAIQTHHITINKVWKTEQEDDEWASLILHPEGHYTM